MSEAQNPLRLPWRADGVFVLNCDDYPIADANTKREVAAIVRAVNRYDALVELVKQFLQCPEIADCAQEDKEPETDATERTARALLANTGGEG